MERLTTMATMSSPVREACGSVAIICGRFSWWSSILSRRIRLLSLSWWRSMMNDRRRASQTRTYIENNEWSDSRTPDIHSRQKTHDDQTTSSFLLLAFTVRGMPRSWKGKQRTSRSKCRRENERNVSDVREEQKRLVKYFPGILPLSRIRRETNGLSNFESNFGSFCLMDEILS